ncbi:MAG TPA: hypothetical protein VGM73_17420 [Candidatus Didemnitutus sp.]|jgi:hypothetical protein
MKSPSLPPVHLLAGLALAVLPAQALISADQPAGTEAKPAAPARPGAVKRELEKGMTAGQIVALIGKPESIEKMKAGDAKAEKWIYRRDLGHRVEPDATTVVNEETFVGIGGNSNMIGTRPVMQYSMKQIDTYRVTALLMVNDKLVVAKQWNEQKVSYGQ